ncbi:MAG: hypothetical protein IJR71_05690 [Prevotella sp.]|nr:hypothetical protein [Prevotella sp.]
MKKYIFTMLCALMATAMNAQDVMVIEKNDDTTTKFNLSDIRRIYFENSGNPVIPPTSNSQLICRLKDKDGNPVLLSGIQSTYNPDRWLCKYDYDQSGNLVSVIDNENTTYNVNGLNIIGQYDDTDETEDINRYEILLKLNEAGFISEAIVTIKEFYRTTGTMKRIESVSCSYSYDKDEQMIESKCDGGIEKYNEDGTLRKRTEQQSTTVYTWSGGNLKSWSRVKREKENGEWTEKTSTKEYDYGSGVNITRQQLEEYSYDIDWPCLERLGYLGLFGVGSKNFEVKTSSYSLNNNGTVDTVSDRKYIYK